MRVRLRAVLASCQQVRTLCAVRRPRLKPGPDLKDFIAAAGRRMPQIDPIPQESDAYLSREDLDGGGRTVKFTTYGCQMNVADVDVVRAILKGVNYREVDDIQEADIVLLMTCSIREHAEKKVLAELRRTRHSAKQVQTIGILGCMAERLRHSLLENGRLCDVVAGPDSYRDLPRLLAVARSGRNAINVQLSFEETYAEVAPVRKDASGKTAFVSIMRGCDNMCTYCVVPFTRGRERSRPIESIVEEVRRLSDEGVRQVTLLGQNVNSYRDMSQSTVALYDNISSVPGFQTVYKPKEGGRTFATLLDHVSRVDPEMRIRFVSPHPKDFPAPVLDLIAERPNIARQLHVPAQSGDDETLERMGRGYTVDLYLRLIDDIKRRLPGVCLTSDFIAGFCGETREAHNRTLELIRRVQYDFCYVFAYSKTRAHRRLLDDVPQEEKHRRHLELAAVFREESAKLHKQLEGSRQLVLVEGRSKRSADFVAGRTDGGTKVILPLRTQHDELIAPGDYVEVRIDSSNSQTLEGAAVRKSSIAEFSRAVQQ